MQDKATCEKRPMKVDRQNMGRESVVVSWICRRRRTYRHKMQRFSRWGLLRGGLFGSSVSGRQRERRQLVEKNSSGDGGWGGSGGDGCPRLLPMPHAALEDGGWTMVGGGATAHARDAQGALHGVKYIPNTQLQ